MTGLACECDQWYKTDASLAQPGRKGPTRDLSFCVDEAMRISGMKKARGPWGKPVKDFLRLARADDLLSRLGSVLMRSSPKATMWTAGIALSGRLASYLGLPGFTRWQALTAPIVVGSGFLGLGAALRYVPRALSGKLTAVAEANDLNLMEDYRKSQAVEHLNVLWDKVFWYESEIRYTGQQRQEERDQIHALRGRVEREIRTWGGDVLQRLALIDDKDFQDVVTAVLSERPLTRNIEKSREGFIVSALYALRHSLPQSSEAYDIGFRLSLYEDLCDGAYFDRSDVKLSEQFAGNQLLADVKKAVRFGRIDGIGQLPKKITSQFWFFLVTRKIATGAGAAVGFLNEKYGTDAFNSQVLLWPGEESAAWLDKWPGAKEDVLTWRRSILHAALGRDWQHASEVIDRAFLPCFVFAAELRARYDPEYCDQSLDYISEDTGTSVRNSLIGDLESLGFRKRDIDRARRYAAQVKREQSAFMDYVTSRRDAPWGNDRVTLRAVRIAFHTNRGGMKKMLLRGKDASRHQVDREIDRAVAEASAYGDRLVGLRLHHQLALLQLAGYKDLAARLAYPA